MCLGSGSRSTHRARSNVGLLRYAWRRLSNRARLKVAYPDRPVVTVIGDGGFLFGGPELATAVQHGINLVTVLFNNSAYDNVLRDQRRLFERETRARSCTIRISGCPRKSFGVAYWRATDADGLRIAVAEALASRAPALVEVITDISEEYPPWKFIAPRRSG